MLRHQIVTSGEIARSGLRCLGRRIEHEIKADWLMGKENAGTPYTHVKQYELCCKDY